MKNSRAQYVSLIQQNTHYFGSILRLIKGRWFRSSVRHRSPKRTARNTGKKITQIYILVSKYVKTLDSLVLALGFINSDGLADAAAAAASGSTTSFDENTLTGKSSWVYDWMKFHSQHSMISMKIYLKELAHKRWDLLIYELLCLKLDKSYYADELDSDTKDPSSNKWPHYDLYWCWTIVS